MKLEEDQARRLIPALRDRFDGGLPMGSIQPHGIFVKQGEGSKRVRAWGKLHDQIAWRRAHFFNAPEADPVLPDPYGDAPAFQSDAPRQKWIELKARLTENPFTVRVESDETTQTKRDTAQLAEDYMNDLMVRLQSRCDQAFQESMADAQIIDGVGFLHWWSEYDRIGEWPEYEYRDDLRDTDADEKKRYKRNPEYTEGSASPKHSRRLKETTDSLNERRKRVLAETPDPYGAEVLSARNVYWVPNKAMKNGLGIVVTIRELGWLNYQEDTKTRRIKDADGNELRAVLENGKLRAEYIDVDAPMPESPSWDGWDETVSLVTIWTDTEWHELAVLNSGGASNEWAYMTGGTHDWGMPPFAIFTAIQVADYDPSLSYQPALAGMYRMKAFVDEAVTLMHVIARNIAMPWFYLESKSDGARLLDEDGNVVKFTPDAALGNKIPDGFELKWVSPDLNAAYPQSVALLRDDWQATFPATGTTDTTATSQPWTVRLKQQEANVTPRKMVDRQVQPLDIMGTSIMRDCARRALDEPEESLWYDGGKGLKGIPASDLKAIAEGAEGFKLHIRIDATSAAEKVTQMQLGAEFLKNGWITEYQYWDEFAGDPDPQKRIDEVVAERGFKAYWEPGIIRQELARIQGTDTIKNVVAGTNGELVGPNGQAMAPEDVLAANGITSSEPQPAPAVGGMAVDQAAMPPITTPGTVPVGGAM